jgi:two-component system sensor histidine kinase CpxA
MKGVRFSLFSKIMLWFFLNLLILGVVLFFVFNLNFRVSPGSRFFGESPYRTEALARLITEETRGGTRAQRDEVLRKYSAAYRVEFFIFEPSGTQLGGREIQLPPEITAELARTGGGPREIQGPGGPEPGRPAPGAGPGSPGGPPPRPPFFFRHTSSPSMYWSGSPIFVVDGTDPNPHRASLVASSDSFTGHGLFFDPTPWLIIAGVIIVVSIVFWFPLLRGITRSVAQLTAATESIADEKFAVRVDQTRKDELGRLGSAINQLATRLSGFVQGQKRFLGDISHELNSPLARMQVALDILELRSDESQRSHLADVREEVELMARLVSELLDYSRAGIRGAAIERQPTALRDLVEVVLAQEAKPPVQTVVDLPDDLEVMAQRELLARAFANVVRNAVRYGGDQGTIEISAADRDGRVQLTIADQGPGVPPAELERLFDPFYRVAADRARESGGSGLGLAIVRSCIEACGGSVIATNRDPSGLAIIITLDRAGTEDNDRG